MYQKQYIRDNYDDENEYDDPHQDQSDEENEYDDPDEEQLDGDDEYVPYVSQSREGDETNDRYYYEGSGNDGAEGNEEEWTGEEDDELYDEDDEEFDGEGSVEGEGNQGRGYYNDTDLSRQSSFRSSIAPADKTKWGGLYRDDPMTAIQVL